MSEKENLYVLWTTGDPITAKNMVLMYATNSLHYKWWAKVHITVWGAAAQLLASDESVQEETRKFLAVGGTVSICRRCVENIGIYDKVKPMEDWGALKVFYVGESFTKILESGQKLITV